MHDDEQFGQIRLVGKISLWFSLVVLLGLTVVVVLAGTPKESYIDSVQALSLTRKNLPYVMLVGGLILALGTALTTWVITVYSTFRVAGPLYRFSRNLEAGIREGRVARIHIRQTDYLQEECELLEQTVTELDNYRHGLRERGEAALRALEAGPEEDRALAVELEQLQALQGRTHHDPNP